MILKKAIPTIVFYSILSIVLFLTAKYFRSDTHGISLDVICNLLAIPLCIVLFIRNLVSTIDKHRENILSTLLHAAGVSYFVYMFLFS